MRFSIKYWHSTNRNNRGRRRTQGGLATFLVWFAIFVGAPDGTGCFSPEIGVWTNLPAGHLEFAGRFTPNMRPSEHTADVPPAAC